MQLISSSEKDYSTNKVIDYLKINNFKYLVINENNKIENLVVDYDNSKTNIKFEVNNKEYFLINFKSYWYRKSGLKFAFLKNILINNDTNQDFINGVISHLKNEEQNSIEYFLVKYLRKITLGNYYHSSANHLLSLSIAQDVGLTIPKTIITSKKSDLMNFYIKCKSLIISKGVQDILSFNNGQKSCFFQTEKIELKDINEMSDSFFPSLFQEQIQKKYELRIFYIDKRFFSMAIFSQSNKKTLTDFRNYDFEKPNRNVPYKLPKHIEEKLILIMDRMSFNTGSIDMIYDLEGNYIFLEINPVGQYGMTSVPCNYNLDFEIAKSLMNENK